MYYILSNPLFYLIKYQWMKIYVSNEWSLNLRLFAKCPRFRQGCIDCCNFNIQSIKKIKKRLNFYNEIL